MVGQSMIIIRLVLFLWLINNQVASGSQPTAKPGCASNCGNVSIPFPFGIGTGCFLDEWFEIVCGQNSTTTPILKRTNQKVMKISVEERWVQVRNPISFFNCSEKENRYNESADLEGSPFVYSQSNRFAAVGCGSIALMNSGEASIGGCSSICGSNFTANNNSCNGINCCQTTIPSDLKAFTSSFLSIPGETPTSSSNGNECKFAFMVDQQWLASSSSFKNISAIREFVDVPVQIDWELYNYSTLDVFGIFAETNRSFPNREDKCHWDNVTSESVCYTDPFCQSYTATTTTTSSQLRLQCRCLGGYQGNPYLLYGCKDIDECKENPNPCLKDFVCRNSIGGYTCSSDRNNNGRIKEIAIGVGSGIFGLLFLCTAAWLLHKYVKKRRREKYFKQNGGMLLQQQLSSGEANIEKTKLFKSEELEKATDKFNMNRVLGQGGQGTVYKGMLIDGKIVAVKKSKRVDEGKVAEFINEVVILSQINHRNVVRLLGCCLETEVPLLVYEFIPNGTLFQYIHDKNEEFPLTWETRLRIAKEIAGAISYLHSAASFPIYHRDIKSSNILLDEKYRTKIADFGTSRSITIEQTHLTTLVYGTFGYLDPEYFQSSQFTDKSDVYSFGVVLVELLTGQKPISMAKEEEGRSLATSFILSIEENRLFDMVDARVLKEGKKDAIMAFANLAKRCLDLSGKKRPPMKEVANELEKIQKLVLASNNYAEKNFEEIQYEQNEVNETWDVASMSTWSGSYGDATSSSDVIPLVSFSKRKTGFN